MSLESACVPSTSTQALHLNNPDAFILASLAQAKPGSLFRGSSVPEKMSKSLTRVRSRDLEPMRFVSADDDDDYVQPVVDEVQEALRRPVAHRTDAEHLIVMNDLEHLKTFNSMPAPIRQQLCSELEFIEFADAETEIASSDASQYWWAVIQGTVAVHFPGSRASMLISEGSSFGLGKHASLCQDGTYVSGAKGCQIVRVTDEQHKAAEDNHASGKRAFPSNSTTQLFTEQQQSEHGSQMAVVVRGSTAYLLDALLNPAKFDIAGDAAFMNVYLLTFRTFFAAADFQHALLKAVKDQTKVPRILRVAIKWVEQHRHEFLASPSLVQFLFFLEAAILKTMPPGEIQQELNQLRESRESVTVDRHVCVSRPSLAVSLGLNIKGGRDTLPSIFISGLVPDSYAKNAALLTGDQILKLNGMDLDGVAHEQAVKFIKTSINLELVVRFNPKGFTSAGSGSATKPASEATSEVAETTKEEGDKSKSGWKRAKAKLSLKAKKNKSFKRKGTIQIADIVPGTIFYLQLQFDGMTNEVIRVFGIDHNSHFVCTVTSTTAKSVVELMQKIWSLASYHMLYIITLDSDGNCVPRKLEDDADGLMDRLPSNARYYVTDEIISGSVAFSTEARAEFEDSLQLQSFVSDTVRPRDIARCLCFLDFNLFQSIPPLEYVHFLWRDDKEDGRCNNIDKMTSFHNRIRGWIVYEICTQEGMRQRVDMLRKFIKVARACHEVNNFNGLYAVLGALCAAPVSRLKQTWGKLANKYRQQHEDLEALMDPSRNMVRFPALQCALFLSNLEPRPCNVDYTIFSIPSNGTGRMCLTVLARTRLSSLHC